MQFIVARSSACHVLNEQIGNTKQNAPVDHILFNDVLKLENILPEILSRQP